MTPKIAIVGAGPGGLCLANILQQKDIPFTVFESDKTPHERNQGGTLDLHPKYGQLAMREAGLWQEFCQNSRPEADVMKIVRIDGKVLWDGNGPDKHEIPEEHRKPEIDREKLKDILLKYLKPENLRFGMHLSEVVCTSPGKHDLHFQDGTTEAGFDLVVGAEGAWSKVRKLVTDEMPHYSGISIVELWQDNVNETNPWLSQYIGEGSCFCFAEGRVVMMQRLGSGTVRTYAGLRKPESFLKNCGIDFANHQEAPKQLVEQYYADVGVDLQRAILESTSEIIPRALYMLPVGFRWEHKQGVALLGDAAHVMTPFAGVGVNAALVDALDLGKTIIQMQDVSDAAGFDAAMVECENRLFERGEVFAKKTWAGLVGHFSEDGAEKFAQRHRDAYATVG